jgi:hypothetical protein
MRVRDLPGWPPDAAGTIPACGGITALSPEDVLLREVTRIEKDRVKFNGDFNGALVRYTQKTPDDWSAKRLGEIVAANLGNTVFSIGVIEIPEE